MIEVKELTKYYGEHLAVDHLTFSVKEGEILGFLGPNGAGKSTTMNMLTGYLSASSGQIRINGTDLSEDPLTAKRNIGYLPELPPLYMDMTVDEYLKFMFRLKKVSGKEKREAHISDICERVKLSDVRGIAQAMIGDPKILILDEPTVGLDPNQIMEIRTLIRNLGKEHTIILSSHILQEIQAVCNRILILCEGRLAADDTKENLTRQNGRETSLEEIFFRLTVGANR